MGVDELVAGMAVTGDDVGGSELLGADDHVARNRFHVGPGDDCQDFTIFCHIYVYTPIPMGR